MLGGLNVVLVVPTTDDHLFCGGVGDCGVTNSLIISLLAWFYGLLFNTRVDVMSVHDQGRSRVGHEIPKGTEKDDEGNRCYYPGRGSQEDVSKDVKG